jgi:hypothetical protein
VQVLAVDPGDRHNGVAAFTIESGTLRRNWTRAWRETTLEDHLESCGVDAVVCESFHLYPELAREQGYSTFPTCERIGVVKYIGRKRGIPVTMQEPVIKKKGRRIGERLAPYLGSIRTIGTGRSKYRGWDFSAPTQHERDATAHGVWFAFRTKGSPLFELDLKRKVELIWNG